MKETGRFGNLGKKFNELLAFVRGSRLVKSNTLDITQTINGTSIEIKSKQNITNTKVSGGDSVWS